MIKDFIFAHWKIAIVVFLIIGSYLFVNHLIHNAYEKGRGDVVAEVQAKTDLENKQNRDFEQKLNSIISAYGQHAVEQAAARVSKETVLTNTIQTLVKEKPIYTECKVDQSVTDARNAIRELGPK